MTEPHPPQLNIGVLDYHLPILNILTNNCYQQLLHLHCIQSRLLAKATGLLLAQGDLLQDCLQASKFTTIVT